MLPSRTNNHHLKLIFEITGMPSKKLLSHCKYRHEHFDADGNFLEHVEVVNGRVRPAVLYQLSHQSSISSLISSIQDIVKRVVITKPTRSIQNEIIKSYGEALKTPEEKKHVAQLADLITQCIIVDPKKRITPEQAIKHPLFQ